MELRKCDSQRQARRVINSYLNHTANVYFDLTLIDGIKPQISGSGLIFKLIRINKI